MENGKALQEALIAYSQDIGVDAIGFCTAAPFFEIEDCLYHREAQGYMCDLESKDYKRKIYPQQTMKNAKSFLVILEAYDVHNKNHDHEDDKLRGHISMTAVSKDYHNILMEKLEKLAVFLKSKVPCETMAFVDISPFSDRAIACRAGLGFIGKNAMLIHKSYGSKVFIGYVLTDYALCKEDCKGTIDCGTCHKCVEACPTQAIVGDKNVNCNKCLSYLTQHKGHIAAEVKNKMGKQIYGCDVCQIVCPYNKVRNKVLEPIITPYPEHESLLSISNKVFKDTYGKTASGWRGKKILQRNSIIALGNSSNKEALHILEKIMDDPRADIRKEIIDAIWRLGFSDGISLLNKMKTCEKDITLLKDMEKAIAGLQEKHRFMEG
ncbi:tRNA epoxyqueuosine(34) reductase QueG [Vallitalea pronyensis]|uniref:tRNA epoxyqueuosine(34) reductase QueG n=1 Tax=Vallitalea pronyensis TaxID=1348613 RepID=A0A8J8SHC4_9FIRM|nr:tRNA epoxyqueuosine(34) reductase QueG [Vallitalea pronyensis]QUI23294.1 tRNA epoxyqueuosine(34) reductase QueG [Vallitalea pronyensis]